MGRKKIRAAPPKWATISGRSYAPIYSDLLQSKAFKSLKPSSKNLFFVCVAHQTTSDCGKCLHEALKERAEAFGNEPPEACTHWGQGYFVLPRKQAEAYGWKAPNVTRSMQDLIRAGFVDIVQQGARQRVSIYRFSERWKDETGEPAADNQ